MNPKSLRYDEVQVGDELPALDIPVTRTLIVAAAIASRDYQDVHHDPAGATGKGAPDIFMNILTTNGLVGRYITDWAGPDALLTSVRIRLGAPNYPGDTMRLTGAVVKKDDGVVEVAIRGANGLGDHVTGTVELVLPERPIRWSAPGAAVPGDREATDHAEPKKDRENTREKTAKAKPRKKHEKKKREKKKHETKKHEKKKHEKKKHEKQHDR